MKSKVKANFIYNVLYHIFLIIIPLITTPYITRRLGASGIGNYAFEYSVAYYFTLFIKLGLNNYGNRTIAYVRDDKSKLSLEFWSIYSFQLVCALVVTAIYLVYCYLVSSNQKLSVYLIMFVLSASIDITWFFWGMEEFKITVLRSVIIKVLATATIFVFVKTEKDTDKYTFILSLSFFLTQLFMWPKLFSYVRFVKPSRSDILKHIKPNLVLFLPAIAVSLYKIMDKIMLGLMSTKTEVGFYESSEKIINIPMAFIESLGTVMQPRVSNLISNRADENYLKTMLLHSIIMAMLCSTLIGFGIMSIAKDFVPAFYGNGFEKCITLFIILLPSCMFLAFTNVIKSQYLLPRKMDKQYIIALFTGAGVNLTVNALLIPRLASVGAAIGTLIAEMAVCVTIAIIVRQKVALGKLFRTTIPFIFSGLVMFAISQIVHIRLAGAIPVLIVKTCIFGVIYLVMLFISVCICDRVYKTDTLQEMKGIVRSMLRGK